MIRGKFKHSIGRTLTGWFLFLSLLPLAMLSWYGYVQTAQSVDEMQRNKLSNSAVLNVANLNSHFYEATRNLQSWSQLRTPEEILFAAREDFRQSGQGLGDFTQSGEYKEFKAKAPKTMLKLAKQYDYVYDLFLIDLEGNILYTVAEESDLGTNLLNGPYSKTRFAEAYRMTLGDGKAHFSDLVRYAPSNNILTGFITQPMVDDTGKIIGIMGLQLNMNSLFGSIEKQTKGMHHYLVGADGLLRTPIDREGDVLNRRINTEVFWSWYKEHGIHGRYSDTMDENAILYVGPNGKKVLGEHRSINLLGVRWAHISEIDETEVLAVPKRLFTTIAIFLVVVVVVIVIASLMIARRIVKPIKLLSLASQQYMDGVKGVHVSSDADNEIGAFGKLFNALIRKQESDEAQLDRLAQKAQQTLDELKEQKYALDAHSIVAITDVKGTITFVNSKFEEISGYTSDELLGKNHRLLNSGFHSLDFWKEMYRTISHGNIWRGEIYNKAKNGTHYWVETTIVPFMGEDGKPISYIAIRTDITERKKIQKSLNEALQLQKAVFESAGVSIITTDLDGLITSFNAAAEEMTGYRAQEMIGKESPAILHKIDEVVHRAQELSVELGQTVEPGFKVFVILSDLNLPNTHEWTYLRKDGGQIPVYLNVTAMYDTQGVCNGYMGIASDISLFKEAEEQMLLAKETAESSARIKSEFLATMSHEIRTPMNGVLGMLGLLNHSDLDETQRHQVRVASNSASSLLALINDILDFSKVEAGKMELEMIEFNLRDELGDFIEAVAFRAQEKGLELILDTTRLTRTTVITDPGRLRQILTNLIGNAVKFTHRGEILVTVTLDEIDEHNGRLRIDIRDSGIGIAADKIGTLFQTFSQADNSTTRKYGGTGLGLAIVKKLCELMGGSIVVTSTEYEGSTFHVDIGVGLGAVSSLSIPSISVEGKSVLVVDDNETNRAVVRAQLEIWGMEVFEAEDPIIAYDYCQIRIAQGHMPPYDVALLDMQMPNMDGADLGSEIRHIPACDGMKMVMMTSLGSRSDAKRFAEIGFDAFFAKPTTTKDLLNALKVLFDDGDALEGAHGLVTKDYLGTLQEESSEIQWPSNTRLLLVEDNPTNQIVAQGMLEMMGLEADIANNGLEALEAMQLALEFAPYTVIMMDCQMPEMDGYTATEAIRRGDAGEIYKTIPIIAMTANAMSSDREKCMVSGMNDFITKPVDMNVLKNTLIQWLKGIRILTEPAKNTDAQEPKEQKSELEKDKSSVLWDHDGALKRMGGKETLLDKIVQSFVDEAPTMMSNLKDAIASANISAAQLHAHSLKGSSGNIGAIALQEISKALELAAKEENLVLMRDNLPKCEELMNDTITILSKRSVKSAAVTKKSRRVDPIKMAIALDELRQSIGQGLFIDTDASELFGEYADSSVTTRMKELKKSIEKFEYDKAMRVIDQAMEALG